ncbi:MAG TPA: sensor histidine kinase [Betaproteobacteria bacterium]|nr:sensor histidine kinase [Betaproteobacteria bacterium]
MPSIKQNPAYPVTLPNFCNLGITLRTLVIIDGGSIAVALLKAAAAAEVWRELLAVSALVQPVLLAALLLLCAGRPLLRRLSYPAGAALTLALVLTLTTVAGLIDGRLSGQREIWTMERYWLFAALTTAVLLGYFHLRSRALSPAITEARLQALQARIRPHFLFNSINAVLSLIRKEPQRAERALEDLADLFRVLMADNRQLSPLTREVELCRQYLELEQLRLGERLRVEWHIDKMPADALAPPLLLQPLAENAVYHGIEPSSTPGELSINIYRSRSQLHLVLRNPYRQEGSHHAGNKMALNNIRERLKLHFDAEASLTTSIGASTYQVHIAMPYTTEAQ